MEKFKKLLNAFTYKDLQHFLYFLNKADSENMTINSTRTVVQDFIRNQKMEHKRPQRIKHDPERIIPLGSSKEPCPDCGKTMMMSIHTDVDNDKVIISKCKNCQFSKIVEK